MSHYIVCPKCGEDSLDVDTLRCDECGYSDEDRTPSPEAHNCTIHDGHIFPKDGSPCIVCMPKPSPEAENMVETAEEALDCKHIMGNADCSCQDDTDLGDLCRAVRAYRIAFPKKVECICHETVVGKDECPVHGKHPAVPKQDSTKRK